MSPALALALALAAAPASSSPPPPPDAALPATAAPDTSVPLGSPEDRALWRRAYDLGNEIPVERSISTRLQVQISSVRLLDTLEARAKAPGVPHATHEQLEKLGERLEKARQDVVELLTSRWPVDPTRVCGYDLLNFESVMRSDENPRKAAQLALTRTSLQDCVARGEQPLAALRKANDRLRESITAAEQALATAAAPAAATR